MSVGCCKPCQPPSALLVGLLEARGGGDHPVFPKRGVFVALPVQRRQHVLVEASAFFQHRLGGFHACVFKAGDFGDLVQSSQVLHIEEHVFDGGGVAHEYLSTKIKCIQAQRLWPRSRLKNDYS